MTRWMASWFSVSPAGDVIKVEGKVKNEKNEKKKLKRKKNEPNWKNKIFNLQLSSSSLNKTAS